MMYRLIPNAYNQLERNDVMIYNLMNKKIGVTNEFI